MLDRAKKFLIVLAVSASLNGLALAANESTITYISINDKIYEDVEIMVSDGAEILVPFKQLANIFEIKYSANRVDKLITFTSFDGKSGTVTNERITLDGAIVSKKKPIFLHQGIMENVMNEAFIEASVAEKIFGIKLLTDYSTLTLAADTSRNITILKTSKRLLGDDDSQPKAHPDVILPKKNGVISLNKIGLKNNMINDNLSTRSLNYGYSNHTLSGNTTLSLHGNVMNGKYRVESNMYHYKNDAFMFGGVTATYINKFKDKKNNKDYYYELGKVTGRSDVDAILGANILGAQIWDYDYNKPSPRNLKGYVKPTSLVRVTINDGEPINLNTYSGYYSLSDMAFPQNVRTVKIEEINEDGTVETIFEDRYHGFGDKPFEKEKRNSLYAGVWGYQNRLFREGQDIYRGNNKKVTAGYDFQYGIKDNITFESKITADKIYEKTNSKLIYQVPTNDALLVTGTQKSVNYIEGATTLNSIDYTSKIVPNLKARLTAGGSIAHDIREHTTKPGYMAKGLVEYSRDLQNLKYKFFKPKRASTKIEAYHTSPDFYIASTDATSKNDRLGGKVTAGLSFNSTSVGGSYNKYYSNLNHKYHGGTIAFDEYSINASTRVPYIANLRYNFYQRRGENNFGRNKNYTWDAGGYRSFGKFGNIDAGRRVSLYDTRYEEQTALNHNYYSEYADIYTNWSVPIPNNKGSFLLGHNFINYKTTTYKNNYNMFRFGYTFPTWKRLTLGLGWGFRYCGQTGNDLNVSVGYRAQSGQMITVGYQYSKNGGYFIDNMFTPATNRHSVNVIFNDAYQLFHNGFKSIGDEFSDKGIFEAIAFIDTNKNGKYDKHFDIPVKDIPIVTSWSTDTKYTNKRGYISSASLTSGVYKVGLDMNSLPITVAPLTNDTIVKTIKIENGLTTKLELPLISTVGSVAGTLKITDDFDRKLKITDFVVIIQNDKGEEINYSTVDESGRFYISGLAPGKYIIKLDENYISAYGLEKLQNSSREIFIPFDYLNPTDLVEQNLEYRAVAL